MQPSQVADPKDELKDTGVSETDPAKPEDDEFDFDVRTEGFEKTQPGMGKDQTVEGDAEGQE